MIQPMYYDNPNEDQAYHVPNEYLFGSEMICHPITTPQIPSLRLGKVKSWLPEGTFIDMFTGLIYQGSRIVNLYRRISQIPVLLRAGAIVPMAVLSDSINETGNPSELELVIAAGANGRFTLYEDDGETKNYEKNVFAETQYTLDYGKNCFMIHKAEGRTSLLPEVRTYHLRFLGFRNPQAITYEVDGETFCANYVYDEIKNEVLLDPIQLATGQQLRLQFAQKMQLSTNHVLERCFDRLNYAKIDFLLKERIYDILKGNSIGRIMECLFADGVEEELISALSEIILSEE